MQTRKQKTTSKWLSSFLMSVLFLQTGILSFASKSEANSFCNKIEIKKSEKNQNTQGEKKNISQKGKTIIQKWDCETNSWKPWNNNESCQNSKDTESSSVAYTHIKIWDYNTHQWKSLRIEKQ